MKLNCFIEDWHDDDSENEDSDDDTEIGVHSSQQTQY
jgi:hypothetical protein